MQEECVLYVAKVGVILSLWMGMEFSQLKINK